MTLIYMILTNSNRKRKKPEFFSGFSFALEINRLLQKAPYRKKAFH